MLFQSLTWISVKNNNKLFDEFVRKAAMLSRFLYEKKMNDA